MLPALCLAAFAAVSGVSCMSHAIGTHLGGIRTLEDLRGRCVIDAVTECWHLRKADGKPMPRAGIRHVVWMHDSQSAVSATRAAWLLAGKAHPGRKLVYRCCGSYDCINPEHLRVGSAKQRATAQRALGLTMTPAKLRANRENGLKRSRISAELRQWIAESPQTLVEVAHAVEVWPSYVGEIRRKARSVPASVFAWRPEA